MYGSRDYFLRRSITLFWGRHTYTPPTDEVTQSLVGEGGKLYAGSGSEAAEHVLAPEQELVEVIPDLKS